jgi:hypothetical protein
MLLRMQQTDQASPSPAGSSSFAGLLASLASPRPDASDRISKLSGNELGDDVFTLSYERALHNHARYKPRDPDEWSRPAVPGSGPCPERDDVAEALPATSSGNDGLSVDRKTTDDRDLRTTSVTIRLSSAESARLHQRAAEAGVTVSAYLRSCTFEADALRAQVKSALAELRAAPGREQTSTEIPVQHSWHDSLKQLFMHGKSAEKSAKS